METHLALMSYNHNKKIRNDIVLIAFLSALLVVAKEALSLVPNVEVVTLLLIVYTRLLGFKKAIYITFIFTTIQALIYPPHLWIITYFLIWPILVVGSAIILNFTSSNITLAIWAAIFGLSFGAFDSLILSFVYGFHTFIPIWIRGLPWDLVHGFSNYLTVLLLFAPLSRNIKKLIF